MCLYETFKYNVWVEWLVMHLYYLKTTWEKLDKKIGRAVDSTIIVIMEPKGKTMIMVEKSY